MTTVNIPMLSDTYVFLGANTTNYDGSTTINNGENFGGTNQNNHMFMKPDFSAIPTSGIKFISATLYITPVADSSDNTRTVNVYRVLRNMVYNQATWNVYSTGNSWTTGGGQDGTNDYDSANLFGTFSQNADPTLNVAIPITLDASMLEKLWNGTWTNNGLYFVGSFLNDQIDYASIEHATSSYRPYITLVYEGNGFFF